MPSISHTGIRCITDEIIAVVSWCFRKFFLQSEVLWKAIFSPGSRLWQPIRPLTLQNEYVIKSSRRLRMQFLESGKLVCQFSNPSLSHRQCHQPSQNALRLSISNSSKNASFTIKAKKILLQTNYQKRSPCDSGIAMKTNSTAHTLHFESESSIEEEYHGKI